MEQSSSQGMFQARHAAREQLAQTFYGFFSLKFLFHEHLVVVTDLPECSIDFIVNIQVPRFQELGDQLHSRQLSHGGCMENRSEVWQGNQIRLGLPSFLQTFQNGFQVTHGVNPYLGAVTLKVILDGLGVFW